MESGVFDRDKLEESVSGYCYKQRQPEMEIWSPKREIHIRGNMTDSTDISIANLWFSTTASSNAIGTTIDTGNGNLAEKKP